MIQFIGYAVAGALSLAAARSDSDSAVVKVRTFAGAEYVYVVAWSSDESQYGLRAAINAKGQVVSMSQRGYHTLYVSTPMVVNNGGIRTASILPDTVLRHYRNKRDIENCRPAQGCSPFAFSGILLSDAMLRSPRDSLVVTVESDRVWTLVIPHPVIAKYLKTVDSVVAERRLRAERPPAPRG